MNPTYSARNQTIFWTLCIINSVLIVVLGCMAWRIAHAKKAAPEWPRHNLTRIVRVTYSGQRISDIDLLGRYTRPSLWRGGEQVLLSRSALGAGDISVLTLANRTTEHLTSNVTRTAFAVPSPGSGQILFSSWNGPYVELSLRSQDGSITSLFNEKSSKIAEDWSADGRWIAFTRTDPVRTKVYLLQVDTRQISPLTSSASISSEARFSPDGKWIAFTSNESGHDDVYAAPVPSNIREFPVRADRIIRISQDGGFSPEWAKAGELLYISAHMDLMQFDWDDNASGHGKASRLFPLSALSADNYEYLYGGYCVDRAKDQLLFLLNKHVK